MRPGMSPRPALAPTLASARLKSIRSYKIKVVGARHMFGDWYHALLRITWSALIAFIAAAFLAVNAIFALLYMEVGGIAHARPGSFSDAFYFSVQTMGTVGYGAMYPDSIAANNVMVGRVAFSRYAVIAPMEGVPTLMIRVGNERGNSIVEATAHVTVSRTVMTAEGMKFYRLLELKLARERSPAVSRSWTVLHPIVEGSPLLGSTPEALAEEEIELLVTLAGTDDTSYQPVHARHNYEHSDILWGARHADILSETPDGNLVLDIRRFHDVVPTVATESFPYPPALSTPEQKT
jgi:inward rectifier potassium channel